MLYRILGGIYVSSIEPLNKNVDLKAEYKIKHVLSVIDGPIPHTYAQDYEHLQISETDEERTNLLQFFDATNKFIDSALFPQTENAPQDFKKHRGSILIHCAQGSSRSVTVIAAYLMYRYNLSSKDSLHAIRRKSPSADPIENFVEQLELYETMGKKIDETNPMYKQFLLKLHALSAEDGSQLDDDMFKNKETDASDKSLSELRCKRCRQVLALSTSFVHHTQPDAESRQAQFIKRAPNSRRIISAEEASDRCSHFFVEPLKWMQEELQGKGEIEGKFSCPKCDAKVGAYSWQGSRCSCGCWMVPAIHLQSAKVDEIQRKSPISSIVVNQS